MLALFLSLSLSELTFEQRSMFYEGRDKVLIEYVDGFEIIGKVARPQVTHIKYANFTDIPIEDDDYPWPGHNLKGTCTLERLYNETTKIFNTYQKTNLEQKSLYYHPAALKQFQTEDEDAVNNADRYSVRITLSPLFMKHGAPIFIPPGEVVTITIPDSAVDKILFIINENMLNTDFDSEYINFKQRLPKVRFFNVRLNRKVNNIGSPYGGSIIFTYSSAISVNVSEPVTITVSGVILSPFFKYGKHTDDEWEVIKKYPGPMAVLDTGNIYGILPSKYIRSTTRINDVMRWFRSAYQISQTTAADKYDKNPRDGRILNPVGFFFDSYVGVGEAYANTMANYCQFPYHYTGGFINYKGTQTNNWGNVHEMNHHHQKDWANGIDEMSNNAINIETYALTSATSGSRNIDGSNMGTWIKFTHPYRTINSKNSENGLPLYTDLTQYFGPLRFKEYVRSDQSNTLYNKNDPLIGTKGAQMLMASKITKRNMRYNYNFHGVSDEALTNSKSDSKTFQLLDELNLQPFHPVTTIYGVGYRLEDGYSFESSRPFRIPPSTYRLDFVKTKAQRENTTLFGDHVFTGITPVKGTFIEVDKEQGLYDLVPNEDLFAIDECIAHYLDKTTGSTTDIICKFEQIPYKATYVRYTNLGAKKDLFDAYNSTLQMTPAENKTVTTFDCAKITGDTTGWITVIDAKFHVEETGDYEFGINKADDAAALYLSDAGEELALDPEADADHMLIYSNKSVSDWANVNASKPRRLEEGKPYHICFVVYNGLKKGPGEGHPGIRKVGGSFAAIDQRMITKDAIPYEAIFRNQYRPDFAEIPNIDRYIGDSRVPSATGVWDVYKFPDGKSLIKSNSGQGTESKLSATEVLTDTDPTTEYRTNWWKNIGFTPFPHVFEIDMGMITQFDYIYIGGTANRNLFDMNSTIEIRLAGDNFEVDEDLPFDPKNVSLNNEESIIFRGVYEAKSPYIDFSDIKQGRFLRVTFFDNSKKWKDNNDGKSSISEISVGRKIPQTTVLPSTLGSLKYEGKWKETADGYYYNGKANTGEAGAKVGFNVSAKVGSLGIIGDVWDGMGSATVFVDGVEVQTISNAMVTASDKTKMKQADRSYRRVLFFMKQDEKTIKTKKLELRVNSGAITINGIITDCTDLECVYAELDEDSGGGDDPDDGKQDDYDKGSSGKTGIIIGAVVVVVVVAATLIAVFVVGAKKGWWCRPEVNSDLSENVVI